MENEFARRDGELSVEGARTARYQLELSIIDNNTLFFRNLARAFHDHSFSRCARNLESNVPVLCTMHDEQQFPFRLNLLIYFDIRSFTLKTEVTPENTDW